MHHTTTPVARRLNRSALAIFAVQVAATVVVVPLMSPGSVKLQSFLYGFTYASCTGWLAWLVMPRVAKLINKTLQWQRWLIMLFALATVGALGTIVANVILAALGVFQWTQIWQWFVMGLPAAIVLSLVIGISWAVFQSISYRLRLTQSEARLTSLEARLQPHFLFNTLNSIAALIPDNPAAAERMVERFASLLRFSLDSNQSVTVPLEQELKIVIDYLEIERTRFGDRLSYKIEAPLELQRCLVPPFCIQTLVENCLKHGQSGMPTNITITALQRQHTLTLEVSDSGSRFDNSHLIPGHGLADLKERLGILSGNRGSLDILSNEDSTTVRLTMPTILSK